jgi:hypothetical protein
VCTDNVTAATTAVVRMSSSPLLRLELALLLLLYAVSCVLPLSDVAECTDTASPDTSMDVRDDCDITDDTDGTDSRPYSTFESDESVDERLFAKNCASGDTAGDRISANVLAIDVRRAHVAPNAVPGIVILGRLQSRATVSETHRFPLFHLISTAAACGANAYGAPRDVGSCRLPRRTASDIAVL